MKATAQMLRALADMIDEHREAANAEPDADGDDAPTKPRKANRGKALKGLQRRAHHAVPYSG